jgi:uncharacterized protein
MGRENGEASMARYEFADATCAGSSQALCSADTFFDLGMMYSTGRLVAPDLVSAHKWFNIAAMRGNAKAVRHRIEIAAEMSQVEIAAAQRAARNWLAAH